MILALVLSFVAGYGWPAMGYGEFGTHLHLSPSHVVRPYLCRCQYVPLAMSITKDICPRYRAINASFVLPVYHLKDTCREGGVRQQKVCWNLCPVFNDTWVAFHRQIDEILKKGKIGFRAAIVNPNHTLDTHLSSFRSTDIFDFEKQMQPVFINYAGSRRYDKVSTDLGTRNLSLFATLIKCGIVCRNRLSHQQDRDEGEYRNKQASEGGNPLGGGIIPESIIWWLLAVGIATGGILATNWAIPPNKDKNGGPDPTD